MSKSVIHDLVAGTPYKIIWYKNQGNVGIAATETPKVSLYPNPATNRVHLSLNTAMQNISLYDLTGKKIMNMEVENIRETTIQLSGLTTGICFIRIQNVDQVLIRKFIKR
ncbi:MAG: T9SS type A sorting domain-containing protein [Bacteroidales bacterium]|nr:T9SS type A sorting domain-containing protein [Bacteroidales bacterium]